MDWLKEPWRNVGWNGIRLQVPPHWHPAEIYPNYILFKELHQPICALKWQQGRADLDPKAIAHKLQKSLGQAKLTSWAIPQPCKPLLTSFFPEGFTWQSNEEHGVAFFLLHKGSHRLLLLQLFGSKTKQIPFLTKLLSTLQEQQEQTCIWTVFDIMLLLPTEAMLTSHEFLPGSFRLQFTLKNQILRYYRFRPAAALLHRQTLSDFGATVAGEARLIRGEGSLVAEWQRDSRGNLLSRLRNKPACSTTRVWHIPDENIILGLNVEGKQPISKQQFDTLCTDYTTC